MSLVINPNVFVGWVEARNPTFLLNKALHVGFRASTQPTLVIELNYQTTVNLYVNKTVINLQLVTVQRHIHSKSNGCVFFLFQSAFSLCKSQGQCFHYPPLQ